MLFQNLKNAIESFLSSKVFSHLKNKQLKIGFHKKVLKKCIQLGPSFLAVNDKSFNNS